MTTKLIFPKLKNTEPLRNTGCHACEKNKASKTICHQVLSMEAQESRKNCHQVLSMEAQEKKK
jgi:hypothetical protein